MGCSLGTDVGFDAFTNTEEFQNYQHEFKLLDLSMTEVRRMYLAFDSITCGLKSMPVDELLESVGLPRTLFAEKLFLILSVNKSRETDFRLFVLCVWNFCTLTRLNMGEYLLFSGVFHSLLLTLTSTVSQTCLCTTCTTTTAQSPYCRSKCRTLWRICLTRSR